MKLIPKETQITPEGEIIIKKFAIIDNVSGEEIRIAKVTPELELLIQCIEIDITDYLVFQEMQKKNSNITKLVNTFNLKIKKL